ncbi:MAG: quinol dehydrogenase ferredoxin subunit NapH [Pseudomonadales bacterium]|nr:quinol dehydrogenase ferredoxin subunit NapH [Pseudomonadales bacterium]
MTLNHPGENKWRHQGWFAAHRWLLLRRTSQLLVLGIFLVGPLTGFWLVKGNLASSLTLGTLPLTDPYVLLQTLATGHVAEATAFAGAAIVLVFYLLVGGRLYCSWVCPVNMVTDTAEWLRRRLQIKANRIKLNRATRYWILVLTFVLPLLTGALVWELVNPVSLLFRGIIFGIGAVWVVVLAIFLFDLCLSQRGWCRHLCPVGAFYSLLGYISLVRIGAVRREHCDDCMDCFTVCPETQVIKPALKGEKQTSPVIFSGNCTHCARCIDVCDKNVFSFTTRFSKKPNTHEIHQMEVTS